MRDIIRKGFVALGIVALMLAGVVSPAEAAPAKVIKCKTKLVRNSSTRVTASVVSLNGTGTTAAVHSVIFEYSDGDGYWTRTFDKRTHGGKGYGPSIATGKHNGVYAGYGYLPFAATMWQAGTRCARSAVSAG